MKTSNPSGSKKRLRWGVLGAAKIATVKVIPGMQKSELCDVTAIASRDISRAQQAAERLGLPKAYGSYEELLADPEIDVIYNPLPNHLHVPWTIKAAEAGKHVLCEKPIALSAAEANTLLSIQNVTVGEAFMVRTHPLWFRVRDIIQSGEIGELRVIMSAFSYFNDDPNNIRNIREIGGGGVMDIGCYPITMSRFLYGREPVRAVSLVDRDPQMGTDRLASAILDFESGQATFTCSTQLVPFQTMQVLGTRGRVYIEIPYNIPPDEPTRIFVDDGSKLAGRNARVEEFPTVDQYALQGDAFSRAVLGEGDVPVTVGDAVANMSVIDAVLRSGETGSWEVI